MCRRYLDTSTILRLLDGHLKLKLHGTGSSWYLSAGSFTRVSSGGEWFGERGLSPLVCFWFFFWSADWRAVNRHSANGYEGANRAPARLCQRLLAHFPFIRFQTAILPLPGLHSAPCLQFKACSVILLTQVDLFLNFDSWPLILTIGRPCWRRFY